MKNLIKSRRGIAIEMAIGAMFIMIALSIVLISISGMQNAYKKQDVEEFNSKIEINEIGEYVCKHRSTYIGKTGKQDVVINNESDSGYDVEYISQDNTNNYQFKIYKGDAIVLIIEIDNNDTITSWGN